MTSVSSLNKKSPPVFAADCGSSPPFVFDAAFKKTLWVIANTLRTLAMDAVQRAGSGHAGTPMGCADIGAYLYGYYLKHNPQNPKWVNRDRFILSAGHASMLQYSCLHLSGFSLSLEDLKHFRQLNSITPSHPQYGLTVGVETTTGLDGQGIAYGVGQALGQKLLAERFNRKPFSVFDSKVIVLAGDGCFMEGVSHEASSLAGHLNLNNLILIYDRNKTSLDGFVSESCSEDTKKRYQAYGWEVYEIDGHNFDSMHRILSRLRDHQMKPALVIADTVIGKGAPTKAGSYLIHSEPIGLEERSKAKMDFGFSDAEFFVPPEVYDFFAKKLKLDIEMEARWKLDFQKWKEINSNLHSEFEKMANKWLPEDLESKLAKIQISHPVSGRKASSCVLNFLGNLLPGLYGGSADLARSDMTHMDSYGVITADQLSGRNIKYGVREFGMATIAVGLAQTEMLTPFIGTFLAFSEYMLSAIRMAALMNVRVIYQLTHDSIFIGQDGPTHQPLEHISHLRSIPNLQVIRPADANEVKMAWLAALKHTGPTAIILSRQDLPLCIGTNKSYSGGVGRGAYILKDGKSKLDFTLIATGSEVALTLKVSDVLENRGFSVRVVSMPSWELFEEQPEDYKEHVLGPDSGRRVSVEAAAEIGWHKYVLNGTVISLKSFGKSATSDDLAKEFGFTVDQIVDKILSTPLRSRL